MNGLFNPENRFWAFAGKVVDVLMLSFLWFLFSIPLVTVGAATTALYYFTLHQVEDTEDGILNSFVNTFFSCFVKATALWIGEIVITALLLFNFYFCLTVDATYLCLLLSVFGAIALVVMLTQFYLFPLVALFRFSIKKRLPTPL